MTSPNRRILFLWLGIACLVGSLVAVAIVSDASQKSRALAHDGIRNLNLARAVAEHTGRTLAFASSICRYLQKNHRTLRGDELYRYLEIANINDAGIVQVALTNADGIVEWTNLGRVSPPVSVRDREHFKVHEHGGEAIFLGKPVLGRVSQKWTIQLSCRLEAAHKKFAGVAVVSVDPNYFSERYADFNLGPRGRVMLIGSDGILRARSFAPVSISKSSSHESQNADLSIGRDMNDLPVMQTSRGKDFGYNRILTIDRIEVLHAWYKVPDFELKAHVATDIREVLGDYYDLRNQYSFYVALVCLLLIIGGLLVTRTVRRQEETIRVVEQARLKAEESDRFKSEFVTAMSHEIRGPLTNIQGFAELISTQQLDEATTRDFAATILRASHHLLTVISTVLDAEKIGRAKLVLHPEQVDLRRMLGLCMQMHEVQAAAKNLQSTVDVKDSVPASIYVDGLRLSQVVHNLVGNAVKFTESGEVNIRAEADEQVLRISVNDTGPGIAPEYQSRIFEKYVQGDPKLSRIHGGTGLGLNLSRMIVELMGGRINCQSEKGAGCTFVVELPLGAVLVKPDEEAGSLGSKSSPDPVG